MFILIGEEDLISVVACLCPIALICIRGNAREKRAIEVKIEFC